MMGLQWDMGEGGLQSLQLRGALSTAPWRLPASFTEGETLLPLLRSLRDLEKMVFAGVTCAFQQPCSNMYSLQWGMSTVVLRRDAQVRSQFRKIFMQMGFEEMPTNAWLENSFWNFDSLFQPQQHPARDAHDTFFLTSAHLHHVQPAILETSRLQHGVAQHENRCCLRRYSLLQYSPTAEWQRSALGGLREDSRKTCTHPETHI